MLKALNPYYGFYFATHHGWGGFVSLGAVVLAVTGAEALYADMGHFGRHPIQTAWLSLVLPSLALNYAGQGALLLRRPDAIENPFFLSVPEWGLVPLIMLATAATVIASQAVISGAYSLIRPSSSDFRRVCRSGTPATPKSARFMCQPSTGCCWPP